MRRFPTARLPHGKTRSNPKLQDTEKREGRFEEETGMVGTAARLAENHGDAVRQ